ncbi:hypothetical protein BDN72DRAFT_881772 [Pluteus cervinus]|uniref:Uncharacterized protein n=1 Tax=Pluteus cervinus TaxID=181527 RepID=A0ACD3ADR0_9AGAR|nr:hypothetical protein BDN72DRAFT_881772 [Pluteus cervinus]
MNHRRGTIQASEPPSRSGVFDGTRTRHVEQLVLWAQGQDESKKSVRFILGRRGTGKSALAETIVKKCRDSDNQQVLTFTFDHETNHIRKVVPTLAHQLVNLGDVYRDHVVNALRHHATGLGFDVRTQWSELIIDTIQQSPSSPLPVLIVIDGLDQCSNKMEQTDLLRALLAKPESLQRSVKILISSRPTHHIRADLEVFGLHQEDFHTLDDSPEDRRDMTQFLRSSLRRISLHSQVVMELPPNPDDNWPPDDTMEKVVNLASGQFSVAAAVVAFLEPPYRDPQTTLAAILAGRTQAFRQLHLEYLTDMDQAKKDIPPEFLELLDNLSTFLVLYQSCQSRPLSITSLSSFWGEEPSKIQRLLASLDLDLAIKDGAVWFCHKSFLDFILSPTFPHPYVRSAGDFSLIATRSLRTMRTYRSVKEADAAIVEATFAQWLYQCGFSTPTLSLLLQLRVIDRKVWIAWAVEQPWSLIDPAYAYFISWIRSQYLVGWVGHMFHPQLLFDARRDWLRKHPNDVIRTIIDRDLRSLYDQGEINAARCLLLMNMLHEQVLTDEVNLQKFGSDKTGNIEALRQMLDSKDFQANTLRFQKGLLPFEDRPWNMLTKNDVSFKSVLAYFTGYILSMTYYSIQDLRERMRARGGFLKAISSMDFGFDTRVPFLFITLVFILSGYLWVTNSVTMRVSRDVD